MNMRKIIAVLAAVLMLCAAIPMGALSVAAAPGDVALEANFDNGLDGFQSDVSLSAEGGYLTFDAPGASWVTAYAWGNNIKANTYYVVTFSAKANRDAQLGFQVKDGWGVNLIQEFVDVTTEWQDYTLTMSNLALTQNALVMFLSNYDASVAPIFYIDNVKIVEAVDPALIGKVVNGDFSDNSGWTLGNGATIADGMLTLTNIGAWSEAAMQTVPVKTNTNYEITWKSQCVSGSGVTYMTLMDSAFNNLQLTSGQIWMNSTSADWINHSVTLNTGDHESIIFKLTSEDGNTKTINIDDVKITEIKDPSFDGYIYNGDFELGTTNFKTGEINITGAWVNLYNWTSAELVEGYNGDYAIKGTASGNYNPIYQPVAVTPNTNYTVVCYSKDSSNSALWIKNSAGQGDIKTAALNSGSDWAMTSLSFNSGSNSIVWIALMGISAGATYTVDDVTMFEAAEQSNDGYIINGNFETGSVAPWDNLWGSCPTVETVLGGKDDHFALHVVSGQWQHVRQTGIAVEPNTDYKISLWAKNAAGMSLLVKDGADKVDIANAGVSAGDEWTEFVVEFNTGETVDKEGNPAGPFDTIIVSLMGNQVEAYGTFDNIVMEKVEPACEHEYFYPCDPVCMLCYEVTNPDATHNVLHVEAVAPTCTANGNIEYWYCEYCGVAWADEAQTQQTNLRNVVIPAAHTYDDNCDSDCNICGEWRFDAPHNLTSYVEAVVPTNCQEQGHPGYWVCEDCGGFFENKDDTSNQLNPAWMYYTGDHVRPEGVAPCAVVACELCGEDSYGDPCTRPDGTPECTDVNCVYCGEIIFGWGHNYNTGDEEIPLPLCGEGDCIYCGEHFEKLYDHENGAWAPCLDGECSYGCGLTYPATADHVDEDGDDYCDTCWNHLAHVDADGDGWCDICWSEMPEEPPVVEIVYGDADGNGEVNGLDEVLLAQYNAGWEVELDMAAADADGNGEVNGLDEVLLAQYNAGWEVVLGPQA